MSGQPRPGRRHARTRPQLSGLAPARVRYATLLAVCKECAGEPKPLRQALKRVLKERGRRDVRVVASSCLDVCPKRAATVAASGAGGTRVLIVKPGARAEDVADALLEDQNSRG